MVKDMTTVTFENRTLGITGYDEYHTAYKSLLIIAITAVIIAGFLGNAIMCVTLLRTPQLRTVTNIFTASLGLADLGIICFVLPMWITTIILDEGVMVQIKHIIDLDLCQATGFVTSSFMLVTVATVSGISLDKYFCICHPLKYPCQMTSKKVIIFLGYIWLQSLFLASTPLYGWGIYRFKPRTASICLPDWTYHISYSVFLLTLGLVLPFFIMIFSYICIFQAARKQARRIQQFTFQLVDPWADNPRGSVSEQPSTSGSKPGHKAKVNGVLHKLRISKPPIIQAGRIYTPISKNIKTLKTVFIAVGVFVVCWVPYVIVTIHSARNHTHPTVAEFITTLLVFSICAINPIIFIFLTRDFRIAVLKIFTRCQFILNCKKSSANKVGPLCEDKRVKITIMGQEASVHVIHLKQKLPSMDSGVDTSSDDEIMPEPAVGTNKVYSTLFQACTSTKSNKAKQTKGGELPVLQCNGESLKLSDLSVRGSTSYQGKDKNSISKSSKSNVPVDTEGLNTGGDKSANHFHLL